MEIKFSSESDILDLQKELEILEGIKSVRSIMVMACDGNDYDTEALDSVLTRIAKPLFGGIFPSIIYNDKKYDKGFILVGYDQPVYPILIENMSKPDYDFDSVFASRIEMVMDLKTIFVFVDGFAQHIGPLINSVFTYFGLEFNYIGGGAGSLSLQQKPCVITNKGLLQDCVIMAGIDKSSSIGVQHGWTSIAGAFEVTKSSGNIIYELDHIPAFDVYKKNVENHCGRIIGKHNFFDLAKAYPFGINKLDAEKIVRDPIALGKNNEIVCVGEIEKGTFVDILNGNKESLISAAGKAIQSAMDESLSPAQDFVFFIDCISRVLYLEDDFKEEISEVYNKTKLPMIGALTIGEIANSGKDYLEFHNKTSVVGCF